jgi:hypothetical protein
MVACLPRAPRLTSRNLPAETASLQRLRSLSVVNRADLLGHARASTGLSLAHGKLMKKRQADGKLRLLQNVIRDLKPADLRRAAGGNDDSCGDSHRPNCTGLSMQCGATYTA